MSLLQLVVKQMRQRALSTWLTLASVALGVGLATAVLVLQSQGEKLFGQSDFGYDLVIGQKGSRLNLVLNSVYHLGDVSATGNIAYDYCQQLPGNLPAQYRGTIAYKIPIAFGDSYQGHRIIGTTGAMFGVNDDGTPMKDGAHAFQFRKGRRFEFAVGRAFDPRKFEAVIGAEVSEKTGLKLGGTFKATHGVDAPAPGAKKEEHEHNEVWTVAGILKPTGTSNDRVVFIGLRSFYAIPDHSEGLTKQSALHPEADASDGPRDEEGYRTNGSGAIELKSDPANWQLSSILVRLKPQVQPQTEIARLTAGKSDVSAINPTTVMDKFLRRPPEERDAFAHITPQESYGCDIIVGPGKNVPEFLALSALYHTSASSTSLPWTVYSALTEDSANVQWALPCLVADDEYSGHRVVGTTPAMFGAGDDGRPLAGADRFEYARGKPFVFAAGGAFAPDHFEAVVGSDLAAQQSLKIGSHIALGHGAELHDERWKVTGILAATGTANDVVAFVPVRSLYAVDPPHDGRAASEPAEAGEPAGHHHHHDEYTLNADGTINLKLPESKWRVSALFVRTSPTALGYGQTLAYGINAGPDAMAAVPAAEMRQFFDTFLAPALKLLLGIAILVVVVAAVSILVSIYNSVTARMGEIAILRALGATRGKIVALICCEAMLVGLLGAIIGLFAGHALVAGTSLVLKRFSPQGLDWHTLSAVELLYLVGVVLLAGIAGLVPALKAYRTPVATNLISV